MKSQISPQRVRRAIKAISPPAKSKRFSNKDNLFERMILDSFYVVQLIVYLEEKLGVVFRFEDLINKNFRTVDNIVKMLTKKIESQSVK